MNNTELFDSDRHVMEPLYLWQTYVEETVFSEYPITLRYDTEEAMQERVERLGFGAAKRLPPIYMIGDNEVLLRWGEELQLACLEGKSSELERRNAMAPETQLESMDEAGVAWASILPTFAGLLINHESLPAHISLAYADGYNRWLKEYCDFEPMRLNAVGVLSRHDPNTMLAQLDRIITNGWKSITLRPEVIAGRGLGHADYEAFWGACETNGISVAIHGGTHACLATAGTDRFNSHFAMHACSHSMEIQMAFLSLLESGVLERHPKLKFAFLEAGASWIPHWLWRLDNICYPEFPSLTKDNIKMLPSEYFKRQCWVTIELGEPCLRQVIEIIGYDKLLYGSDYPHPDHLQFSTDDIASQLSELSDVELFSLMEGNAKTFFGIQNVNDSDVYEVKASAN
ncbi:amidohydrolase [Photobacterium makurazakiensis]|uniref:amidohydrolase family protein n=1 Tax=Photobacterium makurazakiensis TaxID=2910234 RepID=UPI003D129EF5